MNGNSRDRRLQLLWLSASSLTGIYPHRRRLVLFGTRKRQALWETPVRFHLFCFARQLMKKNFFLSASLYFTWFHFVVQSTLANLRETVLEWQKDRKRFIISHQPRILATCKRFRKAYFPPELPWRWRPTHTNITVGLSVSWLLLTYSTWLHLLCRPWSKSVLISITRPRAGNSASDSTRFNLNYEMTCMFDILYDFLCWSISVIMLRSVMAVREFFCNTCESKKNSILNLGIKQICTLDILFIKDT